MTTATLMTILSLSQGRYRDLSGMTLADALAMMHDDAATFLRQFPECAKYHSPSWHMQYLEPGARCPIGHEWYAVGDDGVLSVHQFNHDSSD